MDAERWQQIRQIFERAVQLPEDERASFLAAECADSEIEAEVRKLLENDPGPIKTTHGGPAIDAQMQEAVVDGYRILEIIGEGGMGIVYLAEQRKPVRRKVALKLVKWGMDGKDVLQRFEAERQALALMSHPSIAKLIDAGTATDGRPYFAMEHVPGLPITEYCDKHKLSVRDRLRLFQEVCQGINHAHGKGVLHRDLKPSNILVQLLDGQPTPRIIDFGVAKALNQRLTEKTLYTEHGRIIGTPEYMSPEQAEMSGIDLDARSDVYSLGALLYELLVGALPFDSRKLREAGYLEIQRRIREDEPTKPSTRFTTEAGLTEEVAVRRNTDRSTLLRALRGDLDWITMRCLEKDPVRRYSNAMDLADDLGRYLDNQPVLAGPPSLAYRLSKAARRHRQKLAVAATVLLALVVGLNLPGVFGGGVAAGPPTSDDGPSVSALCPFLDEHGGFSPDGRYFTHTFWNDGNLMVRDTTTGKSRNLTTDADWGEAGGTSTYASFSGIGPDNRTVAYSWIQDGVRELRVVDIENPEPRTVLRDPSVDNLGFYDFTPNGEEVLIVANRGKGDSTLEFVRLADGQRRVVTRIRAARSSLASVSPDGRWVAYEDIVDPTTSRRQLQLVAVEGGSPRPLAASQGMDTSPHWSPDGKHVVFQSDRGGHKATWAVEVGRRGAVSAAVLVEELGTIHPFGFLADGSFVYGSSSSNHDVFVADYAANRNPPTSVGQRISQRFLGTNFAPCWSPDGKTIAFLSPRGSSEEGMSRIVIVVHDLEAGTERIIDTPGFRPLRSHQVPWGKSSPPHWQGQRIVLSGHDPAGTIVVRSVDVVTGQVDPIPIPDSARPARVLPLSNGDYLYRSRPSPGLFEYSGATGETRTVTERPGAFFATNDEREIVICHPGEVWIVSRTDGAERQLYAAPTGTYLHRYVLAPFNGEEWLIVGEAANDDSDGRHVRIRLRDGQAEPIELGPVKQTGKVRVSPDGRRWAYIDRAKGNPKNYVWQWRGVLFQ